MLVHNDTIRVTSKMAVIEELIKGNDGLVRTANIRTAGGSTNRPITRLVPLEVSSLSVDAMQNTSQTKSLTSTATTPEGPSMEITNQAEHSQQEAALRGRACVANWVQELRAALEDVED